jgi:hypothetical protein
MSAKDALRALDPCELPDVMNVVVTSKGDTVTIHHHVLLAPDDLVVVQTRMSRHQALELADLIVRDAAAEDEPLMDESLVDGLPN